MNPLTPAYDNKIAKKYSVRTLDQKIENKLALQESLGWPVDKNVFVVCVPHALTSDANADLVLQLLPALSALGIQLLVVGKGQRAFAEQMSSAQSSSPIGVHIIKDDEEHLRTMYAAADAAIFTCDPTDLEELQHALDYGAVPICSPSPLIADYNPVQESGNAFVYTGTTIWHVFAAIVRAKETYVFPYDYRTIQRQCMQTHPTEDELEEEEEM